MNELVKGSIWILGGVLLLLKTLDIISFSILKVLSYTWPIFLIAVGFAFLYKKKELVTPLISVLFLLFIFGLFDATVITDYESVKFNQEVTLDDLNDLVLVQMKFWVGSINLGSTNETLLKNYGFTPEIEPDLKVVTEEKVTYIFVSRADEKFVIGSGVNEEWNVELYDNVSLELYLDYGVTDAYIDLRNLKVEKFSLESGVTDNEIFFGAYPTKVFIESGVSDISLSFIKDYPVRIKLNAGISSNNLDGFTKERGYYTYNYDSDSKDFIDVRIDSGVTDINVEVRK